MKHIINLQLLGEGGAGAGASTGAATSGDGGAAAAVQGDFAASQNGEDLSEVVYGKSTQSVADSTDPESTKGTDPAEKKKAFENMIKKGGEWHDEFNEYSQKIINDRFKKTKGLQEQLDSQSVIMQTLAKKYGVDASDVDALTKAIDADNSMWEEAAFKEGLTVEQYREKQKLERENARLSEALEQQKSQAGAEQIYANWVTEADAVKAKYGVEFDMATEMENPEFTQLLGNGVSFEAAYKTIHFDEMVNGAMAATAQNVQQAMVNKIVSRSNRPTENGVNSASNKVFKTDPSKFTDADLDEIKRRVARGEEISF